MGSFMEDLKVLPRYLMGISWVFQSSFKGVSRKFLFRNFVVAWQSSQLHKQERVCSLSTRRGQPDPELPAEPLPNSAGRKVSVFWVSIQIRFALFDIFVSIFNDSHPSKIVYIILRSWSMNKVAAVLTSLS